ncbi:MAG: hypothetical protein U9R02_00925 [Thermodesulfobacteriota bacterium]|nr:hypothetical protein [Thermodesulfobacteriota bacterium]
MEIQKITNIKPQISNKFQHAAHLLRRVAITARAPALRVTEIQKSKQYLVLESFGH